MPIPIHTCRRVRQTNVVALKDTSFCDCQKFFKQAVNTFLSFKLAYSGTIFTRRLSRYKAIHHTTIPSPVPTTMSWMFRSSSAGVSLHVNECVERHSKTYGTSEMEIPTSAEQLLCPLKLRTRGENFHHNRWKSYRIKVSSRFMRNLSQCVMNDCVLHSSLIVKTSGQRPTGYIRSAPSPCEGCQTVVQDFYISL